ncbi:hypothetical protein, partial [Streptomyces sp. GC420]|uniref:hypothetical protein n=1 Tax=Streptomyces sp. GC420 TaxID=2697568 RepID=UPI001414D7E3
MESQKDGRDTRSYSVPAGRPYVLAELRGRLGAAKDMLGALAAGSHPLEFEPVADGLYAAFRAAAVLAPVKSRTGCPEHPDGPLDPEPPGGWGCCLLCNTRRLRGERGVPAGDAAARPSELGYPVPGPPYTRDRLAELVGESSRLSLAVGLTSAAGDFALLADALYGAFVVARELSRPRGASGCAEHPGAPVDPDAPPGEECMFCAGRRRRAAPERAYAIPQQIRLDLRRRLPRRDDRPRTPRT